VRLWTLEKLEETVCLMGHPVSLERVSYLVQMDIDLQEVVIMMIEYTCSRTVVDFKNS